MAEVLHKCVKLERGNTWETELKIAQKVLSGETCMKPCHEGTELSI